MNFIELHEYYYHNGAYLTKPLMCNVNEISNVSEGNDKYIDTTYITMVNGKSYRVKETYKEIIQEIMNANREEDDLK